MIRAPYWKGIALTWVWIPALVMLLATGNSHDPAAYGPSIISWLVHQWMNPASNATHGWLIPLISAFIVWQRRQELREAEKQVRPAALAWIVFFLFLYWAGYRAQQPRLGFLCLVGLLWAVPYCLLGRSVAKILAFPCAYLLFAMPMGFLSALTFHLRLFSTQASAFLINGLGIAVERRGTAIFSATGQFMSLEVDAPCSGLNSLIALSALAVVYAYFTQKTTAGKWLLLLCSVPMAIIGNIARIATIAVVAAVFGNEAALKVYHDFSGYIVFIVAVLLMVAAGSLLNRILDKGRSRGTQTA